MTHTPAPWFRIGELVYASEHHGWEKGEEVFRNRFSAYVQLDRRAPKEEAEANAKLIQAAPDLLEALEAIVNSTDYGEDDERPLMQNARAAIAKARGRAA